MRLDLYLAETARIASTQQAILEQAREAMASGRSLSLLEQAGMLHALQVLVENAIGKAKHLLKAHGKTVPVSAYDAFGDLAQLGVFPAHELPRWSAIVGLRNRIVHDYMNIDMNQIVALVQSGSDQFIVDFLLLPIQES